MPRSNHPEGEKHHYLPVFYLKHWKGDDGRVCEFSRPYKEIKPRRCAPTDTGFIRGLYLFPYLPPAISNFLEDKFFRRTDDRAAPLLTRLLNDDVEFDSDARTGWARFVMTLMHRTPEGLERIRTNVFQSIPAELEKLRATYAANRQPGDPDTFEELQRDLVAKEYQEITIQVVTKLMNSELIGTQLINMQWAVKRLKPPDFSLLTSDRPLIMSDGIGHESGFIMMPISPDRVFIMANNVKTITTIDREPNFAARVNDFVAKQAHKFVYGNDDTQLRFVAKRHGQRIKSLPWEEGNRG
jgi:hypothetical protein